MEKKPKKKNTGRGGKRTPRNADGRSKASGMNGSSANGPVWKPHLDSYRDLRALQFATEEDFARAGELLWGELRDLPYDLVGNHTIFVPAEALPYFKGLKFTETKVLSPSDLEPGELAQLRKEQGPY